MLERDRQTLRRRSAVLCKQLVVDEMLIQSLQADDILTESMAETIMVCQDSCLRHGYPEVVNYLSTQIILIDCLTTCTCNSWYRHTALIVGSSVAQIMVRERKGYFMTSLKLHHCVVEVHHSCSHCDTSYETS